MLVLAKLQYLAWYHTASLLCEPNARSVFLQHFGGQLIFAEIPYQPMFDHHDKNTNSHMLNNEGTRTEYDKPALTGLTNRISSAKPPNSSVSHHISDDAEPVPKRQKLTSDVAGSELAQQGSTNQSTQDNWKIPNDELMQSISNIFSIAISKTINNAIEDEVPRGLRHTILKQLSNCWSQDMNPDSFRSRLKVTKLPPTSGLSLSNNLQNENIQVKNLLNSQELTAKKKILDVYLAEETQQVNDLKRYLSKLEQDLARDNSKLQESRNSIEDVLSSIDTQVSQMTQDMQLNKFDAVGDEGLSMVNVDSISDFNPNTDPDIAPRMNQLQEKLGELVAKTTSLKSFNDRLESVYNLLD
ncbi:hypothetical protein CANMA_004794 [Candida margitis]|uniref:uncharacterized protein n=1 Tax=Candida margitis TaxID=1775924 RepID=UPI00222700B1|nr:uncharacterized protein CANMA_004794 [Candida margitis]KAI5953955.1 hypothetical protein CANMA_004794 [Candida margitis]